MSLSYNDNTLKYDWVVDTYYTPSNDDEIKIFLDVINSFDFTIKVSTAFMWAIKSFERGESYVQRQGRHCMFWFETENQAIQFNEKIINSLYKHKRIYLTCELFNIITRKLSN